MKPTHVMLVSLSSVLLACELPPPSFDVPPAPPPLSTNGAPTAVATAPPRAALGTEVVVSGAASSDPDGDPLRFRWGLAGAPGGDEPTLTATTGAQTSFVPLVEGQYGVGLLVDDGELTGEGVIVLVSVDPPNASAGADQLVHAGDVVTLDGSDSSSDAERELTYSWAVELVGSEDEPVALSGATSLTPTFVPVRAGTYRVTLIVDDGLASTPDTSLVFAAGGAVRSLPAQDAPRVYNYFTAVWTGSDVILWGGHFFNGKNVEGFRGGHRYNPAADTWTAISTVGAPLAYFSHTAVWSGSEMIVWGGFVLADQGGDGARYDPVTDTWASMTTVGAPTPRTQHVAVWTGSRMLVWGGNEGADEQSDRNFVNSGGAYDPVTDTWSATSIVNAPLPRVFHAAFWTGTRLLVWGGGLTEPGFTTSGGLYDPATDTWTATSTNGAPPIIGGMLRTAWVGSAMMTLDADLSLYHPDRDGWTVASPIPEGYPSEIRYMSKRYAVWTGGDEVIIVGDVGAVVYRPAADEWTTILSMEGIPPDRGFAAALWAGSGIFLWGDDGADGFVLAP